MRPIVGNLWAGNDLRLAGLCIRKGVECVFDQHRSRPRREAPSRHGSDAAVTTPLPDTVAITTSAASTDSELMSGLETEGLDCDAEPDYSLVPTDQTESVRLDAMPHSSQLQVSVSKETDLPNDFSLNGFSPETTFSPPTMEAIATPVADDGLMTLFNNTSDNYITNDIVAHMLNREDYSYYYSGKELQLPTFSPVLPPTQIATTATGISPSTDVAISGHFTKTSIKKGIHQAYAAMIIDMIYAYPRMMTRRETLPPFMHACSPILNHGDEQNKLPEHLTNCMGIAQLFVGRSDDTHSFIWSTIRAEIRGFRNRMYTFNKYDALSALQASLLYLIIRAVEDKPQEAKDDLEMLLIYEEICQRAVETANSSCQGENESQDIGWKDWIYMESIRRVACVWFILGLVFHTRTGNFCIISEHFREIFLPCTKAEWEAKTEAHWRKEHNVAASARGTSSATGLHRLGDLIDAHTRTPGTRVSDKLDVWNAGIDHLGMTLNLAVSML
ncbi:hypothetical protein LOCC1_G002248 [Lachnellula occidentalis]|uniref:Xylanolytic transcriptional activator regulatory domain-containing protein n=1 Tax=Lachnellula occidentalis TaxID=215460 RepID=A0A8H8S5Y1_9HELO|nr:hypothetical protein LOCC1_G002248 [Lachnellula occidentalis]